MAQLTRRLLRAAGYGDTNMATNGERRFVTRAEIGDGVVLDVGANQGGWAEMLLAAHPTATLHCFEPSAVAFGRLADHLDGRARLHRIALSDEAGERDLLTHQPGCEIASFYRRRVVNFDQSERVQTRRLDSVITELGIDEIALLKIDTEGHDLAVLRGAGDLLDGRIARIQFEYGGTALDTGVFLWDFFELLADRFDLYRLWRHGMRRAARWSELLELATYQNWVALRR